MRFEPRSYQVGLWVSGLATALAYGGVVVLLSLRWRRREGETPEGDHTDDAQEA
jgi:hypothetical protein